jgi:hypothetical protein
MSELEKQMISESAYHEGAKSASDELAQLRADLAAAQKERDRHKANAELFAGACCTVLKMEVPLGEDVSSKIIPALRELKAVVEKLPKTADGVVVSPGMNLWHCCGGHLGETKMFRTACYNHSSTNEQKCFHPEPECQGARRIIKWDDCYSTREAALAAKQGA